MWNCSKVAVLLALCIVLTYFTLIAEVPALLGVTLMTVVVHRIHVVPLVQPVARNHHERMLTKPVLYFWRCLDLLTDLVGYSQKLILTYYFISVFKSESYKMVYIMNFAGIHLMLLLECMEIRRRSSLLLWSTAGQFLYVNCNLCVHFFLHLCRFSLKYYTLKCSKDVTCTLLSLLPFCTASLIHPSIFFLCMY